MSRHLQQPAAYWPPRNEPFGQPTHPAAGRGAGKAARRAMSPARSFGPVETQPCNCRAGSKSLQGWAGAPGPTGRPGTPAAATVSRPAAPAGVGAPRGGAQRRSSAPCTRGGGASGGTAPCRRGGSGAPELRDPNSAPPRLQRLWLPWQRAGGASPQTLVAITTTPGPRPQHPPGGRLRCGAVGAALTYGGDDGAHEVEGSGEVPARPQGVDADTRGHGRLVAPQEGAQLRQADVEDAAEVVEGPVPAELRRRLRRALESREDGGAGAQVRGDQGG